MAAVAGSPYAVATRVRLSMRQIHHAGEKLFVDYAGKKPEIVDPATGEVREVELFVAVLGASRSSRAATACAPTILTSQLSVEHWHDHLGEATVADAICDRLLHNAHRIVLTRPSWRKEHVQLDT